MPATNDITVLARLREWTDADGVLHRHSRGTERRQAFDSFDGSAWSPAASPGPRPWDDALLIRAAATLAECVAGGDANRLYRRSSDRNERSFSKRLGELRLNGLGAVATDWTFSDDGGGTWASPND